jgi:hypothetical protein
MLLGEDVKNSSQIGVINDFDRVYVQTGTFSFAEGSFREHVLRINKNEPTRGIRIAILKGGDLISGRHQITQKSPTCLIGSK